MKIDEFYGKTIPRENYLETVKAMKRNELENELMTLMDALDEFCQVLEVWDVKSDAVLDVYAAYEVSDVKELKEDNERLRKAVHNIYDEFKKRALKFIVSGVSTGEQLQIFKEIFATYLK